MNKEKQLEQRTKRALRKLPMSRKVMLYIELRFRIVFYRINNLARLLRPRAKVHWIGHHRRPRRLERVLLFTIIIGASFVLRLDQYLLWLSVWSGGAAVFINWNMAYKLIPRRRVHWVGVARSRGR